MRGYNVKVNGKSFFVEIEEAAEGQKPVVTEQPKAAQPPVAQEKSTKGGFKVVSPLPGLVLKLNVQAGAAVKKNDKIIVLEAMKMEHDILAGADGRVAFLVKQGDSIESGAALAVIS